ncbi:unnamed protein product [Sphagnum jensenii]
MTSLLAGISTSFPALAEDEGAKGLFFTQLDHPKESLNTGIQYWIEIDRDKTISRVSNKTVFHSGDKVRFHIKPNIDGYAYIMLRSGSRGEKAVLFPDPQRNEDNKLERGKEYTLPNDGALAFDANPGLEKLTLLLSRTPIDSAAYLQPTGPADAPVQIASVDGGSKDLIPSEVLVSYAPPQPKLNVVKETTTVASETKSPGKTVVKKTALPPQLKLATKQGLPARPKEGEGNVTTVVYKEPSGLLAIDVCLQHK